VWYGDRETVWNKKKNLAGTGVFIKEDFPPEVEDRRKTLYPVYKAARKQNQKVALIADKLYLDEKVFTVKNLESLPLHLQPSNLAVREINNAVLFFGREVCYSNFNDAKFELDGRQWIVEQYFQFHKAVKCGETDIASATQIINTDNPYEHHCLGRKIKVDKDRWNDNIARSTMELAARKNLHKMKS
jgi:hypothetical protein